MKLSFALFFLLASIAGYSMEVTDFRGNLPRKILTESDSFRVVYQGEAAFLRQSSSYDFLVSPNLWPCIGIVLTFGEQHLLIHKDSTLDLNSLKELLVHMTALPNHAHEVKVTIFSRKLRDDLYSNREYFKEYRGKSQEQEVKSVRDFFVELGLNNDKIVTVLTHSTDNTLVLDRDGNCFQASHMNSAFYLIDNLENVSKMPRQMQIELLQAPGAYFMNESDKLFEIAQKPKIPKNFNGYLDLKPFMHESEAPNADWPQYKGFQCEVKRCHRVANLFCSACKKSYYCSRECQKLAWPKHKLTHDKR